MKTKLLFLFFIASLLLSCKTTTSFYQVYKTQSQNVIVKSDNQVSYEDSQCRIDYNLWSEHGNPGFTFYNKTDEIIHLRLDESFYVLNGRAYDYYQNRIYTDGSNTVVTSSRGTAFRGFTIMPIYANSVSSNNQHSVTVAETSQISIPPKTTKTITEFNIAQAVYRDCDLWLYPTKRQIKSKTFTDASSPLRFYNLITYTVGSTETRKSINNDFFVSEITNYPNDMVFKRSQKENCGLKEYIWTFKEKAPEWFYLKYVKSNDYSKH